MTATGVFAPSFPDQDPLGSYRKGRERVTGKSKKYTPEFREEASRLVIDGSRPVAEVARKIGINESTLGYWVKAYRRKHSGEELPLDMPHRARLNELERRVRELEQENAFLKKAAAYFAREHR